MHVFSLEHVLHAPPIPFNWVQWGIVPTHAFRAVRKIRQYLSQRRQCPTENRTTQLSNIEGGSNMSGTDCVQTSHSLSRSYLNHLVFQKINQFCHLDYCFEREFCLHHQGRYVSWGAENTGRSETILKILPDCSVSGFTRRHSELLRCLKCCFRGKDRDKTANIMKVGPH
jgi:hypothetical protein